MAIGGNAILNPERGNPKEQQEKIDGTCREIARIAQAGHDVVLTHGNGPQIGNILAMQEECARVHPQSLDIIAHECILSPWILLEPRRRAC